MTWFLAIIGAAFALGWWWLDCDQPAEDPDGQHNGDGK